MNSTLAFTLIATISVIIAMILYATRISVEEPNIGILYRFRRIQKKRLTPGLHFYLRKVFGLQIFNVVMVPGRFITIRIRPDHASTRNVRVHLDIEIILRLKLAADGFPTFTAARNLLNWIQVSGQETLFGHMTEDGYEMGALDRVLQTFVEGKVSEVFTQYEPELITANPLVFEQLQNAIATAIYPFIQSWVGEFYVKVQELSVPDEEAREKQKRDANATAASEKVIQQTKIDILKQYRDELGENYATLYAAKEVLEGAQVNLFGTGLTDTVSSLLSNKLKERQAQRARHRKGKQPWNVL